MNIRSRIQRRIQPYADRLRHADAHLPGSGGAAAAVHPHHFVGHEVLHNWWGNGVYPDYAQGNWSEGLTTFMADYAYKERESLEAAREMRRGWLRDFAALAPGQEQPLTTFTSRTHGATQIVGYNKAAMVFLMVRDCSGRRYLRSRAPNVLERAALPRRILGGLKAGVRESVRTGSRAVF